MATAERALESVTKLSKDLRDASRLVTKEEAGYLVDAYHQIQEYRIRAAAQVRERSKAEQPYATTQWLFENLKLLEAQIKRALLPFVQAHPMGDWLLSVHGIGAVLAAGLLAHIDIERAPTVGHIWSFAGLNPMAIWKKGARRPWNPHLKVICWLIGQSFIRQHKNPKCIYGHVYANRKVLEVQRNSEGLFADQAKVCLENKKYKKETIARQSYESGRLPPAQLDQRASRYAVKLFLSHLHEVWYNQHYGVGPPKPYPIAILGHAHHIAPEDGKQLHQPYNRRAPQAVSEP